MKYIVKAYHSRNAFINSRPDYYATDFPERTVGMLKGLDCLYIECREITKHDAQLEGILKRCSFGSKAYNRNLQALFNYQA